MGSSCRGAPRQELMAPASNEFPDLKLHHPLFVERKAEQHDIAALKRRVILGCGKGVGVVIQSGLLWREKTTPAWKACEQACNFDPVEG